MDLKGIVFNGETLIVPQKLSEMADDETHRTVSDSEKAEWSGKQDKLTAGDNITISDDNTISATIPLADETDPTVPQHVKDITEQNISDWNAKIDQTQMEAYAYDKATVDSKIEDTNKSVTDLSTQYDTLNTQVATNTQSIAGHTTDIAGVKSDVATANSNISDLQDDVTAVQGKIPTQASATNQLADKNFVNSSINNLAAFYITKDADGSPFATNAELVGASTFYSGGQVRVPTTNDYAIVQADETKADELGDHPTTRYTYQGGQWEFQYIVNRTSLTSAQIAAINSNITADLTAQITTNKNAIAGKASQSDLTALTTRVTAAETKNTSQDTAITKAQSTADGAVTKNTEQDAEIAKKANAADLANYIPKTDIKTMSAVGDAGYDEPADRQKVISVEALSWWNGAYMGTNSNLQYFKNGEIAGKDEIPRPLWMADSITLEDTGIESDYTIPKRNISLLAANGYTIKGSDKIIFSTTKATYLGVVKSTTDTDAVVTPKFDMATVAYVDQSSSGGTEGAVLYTEQVLTVDQQAQARTNIGAGTSNFDGKYSSLSGTPSLGSLASKSTITSADITDGTIAKADLASAVQTSLGKADTALQSESDPTVPSHVKSITTTNISTWNSGAADNVKYTTQTLTDTQKTQARTNIGAGTSNFNGQYSSLTGTPTLGSLASKSSIVDADVSTTAAIAQSKIANLTTDLAAKATTTALNAVKTTADAAMPKSGGTFTGYVSWGEDIMGMMNDSKPVGFLTVTSRTDGFVTKYAQVSQMKDVLGVNAAQSTADSAASAAAAAQSTADSKYTKPSGGIPANDLAGSIPTTKITGLGSLATKSAIASGDITDGAIMNADINASAAIAQSKISGLTDSLNAKLDASALLGKIYPVGSVYLSVNNVSPGTFIGGTWTQIAAGYALWTASSDGGGTIGAGLPNITGSIGLGGQAATHDGATTNAFYNGDKGWAVLGGGTSSNTDRVWLNASRVSSIYGASSTVQPPAYKVYAWRRTA